MDFVYFLGRFHVLALHIPIGVIMAVAILEILARFMDRCASLRAAAPYLWGFAALSAILTVILGYMHYTEGGFEGPSVVRHMIFGTIVAVVSVVAWALSVFTDKLFMRLVVPLSVVLVVLVSITGHYGGNMTHGSTYLVEYAPGWMRALHGGEGGRSNISNFAEADPFADVVKPILDQRCISCHNDDRKRGELSMVDYDTLMASGDFVPVVLPYDSAGSPLIQRITLYPGHDDFMPAEGKAPLTMNQTEILRWWVDAGAPANTTMAELRDSDPAALDANAEEMLREELGLEEDEEN